MKEQPADKPKLDTEIIVREALALLDEVGLDGLSTRALAARLGVAAPSLYWHIENKQTLLSYMAETMFMDNLPDKKSGEAPWQDWLEDGAHCIRNAALSRRDGAKVIAASRPTGTKAILSFPGMLERLRNAGFDKQQAQTAFLVMGRFTLGWAMAEQMEGDVGDSDAETGYANGLNVIVAGLERQLSSN